MDNDKAELSDRQYLPLILFNRVFLATWLGFQPGVEPVPPSVESWVLTLIRTFPSQDIPFNSFLSVSIHRAIKVSIILKACVKFLPRRILIWITRFFVGFFFGIQVGINHLHDKNTPHIKLSLWCKSPSKRGETTVVVWWKGFSILQWKIHHVP